MKKTTNNRKNTPKAYGNQPETMVSTRAALEAQLDFVKRIIRGNEECMDIIEPYLRTLTNKSAEGCMNSIAAVVLYYDEMKDDMMKGSTYMHLILTFAKEVRNILGLGK